MPAAKPKIEARFASLEGRMEERLGRLEVKVDRQFTWVVALILVAILIPIALRFLPVP